MVIDTRRSSIARKAIALKVEGLGYYAFFESAFLWFRTRSHHVQVNILDSTLLKS
jgi:hypothetical protein